MTEVNSNCPPKPDWQQLMSEMASDNAQIKAILSRLDSDSDAQYTKDMATIASIETDESSVCNQLYADSSKTSNPAQSRADIAQLVQDLNAQRSNVSQINYYHSVGDQQNFQYYTDLGKAFCDYNISPDIVKLEEDK